MTVSLQECSPGRREVYVDDDYLGDVIRTGARWRPYPTRELWFALDDERWLLPDPDAQWRCPDFSDARTAAGWLVDVHLGTAAQAGRLRACTSLSAREPVEAVGCRGTAGAPMVADVATTLPDAPSGAAAPRRRPARKRQVVSCQECGHQISRASAPNMVYRVANRVLEVRPDGRARVKCEKCGSKVTLFRVSDC